MSNILAQAARLADPSFYLETGFDELLRHMRAEVPICWGQAWPQRGFWVVARYDDIKAVVSQPILFSTEVAGIIVPADPEFHLTDRAAKGFGSLPTHTDPPRHDEVRRLFARHFAGPVVARLESRTQQIVDGILDEVRPLDDIDFVMDAAALLPARLICELLGIPEEDWPLITRYAKSFASFSDPSLQLGADASETFHIALEFLFGYLDRLVANRRAAPRDDLASIFAHAELDGESLGPVAVWWAFAILAGGFETSRNILSGGVLAFIQHPDQLALLRDMPRLMTQAVEEIIRWTTPVTGNMRAATADTEIAGQPIAAGDWVTIWWHSANRDEHIFDDPYRFDITQRRAPQLSFGFGAHNCIGRMLAQLEAKVMFRTLYERVESIDLSGEVESMASTIARGPTRMPVRIRWRD